MPLSPEVVQLWNMYETLVARRLQREQRYASMFLQGLGEAMSAGNVADPDLVDVNMGTGLALMESALPYLPQEMREGAAQVYERVKNSKDVFVKLAERKARLFAMQEEAERLSVEQAKLRLGNAQREELLQNLLGNPPPHLVDVARRILDPRLDVASVLKLQDEIWGRTDLKPEEKVALSSAIEGKMRLALQLQERARQETLATAQARAVLEGSQAVAPLSDAFATLINHGAAWMSDMSRRVQILERLLREAESSLANRYVARAGAKPELPGSVRLGLQAQFDNLVSDYMGVGGPPPGIPREQAETFLAVALSVNAYAKAKAGEAAVAASGKSQAERRALLERFAREEVLKTLRSLAENPEALRPVYEAFALPLPTEVEKKGGILGFGKREVTVLSKEEVARIASQASTMVSQLLASEEGEAKHLPPLLAAAAGSLSSGDPVKVQGVVNVFRAYWQKAPELRRKFKDAIDRGDFKAGADVINHVVDMGKTISYYTLLSP